MQYFAVSKQNLSTPNICTQHCGAMPLRRICVGMASVPDFLPRNSRYSLLPRQVSAPEGHRRAVVRFLNLICLFPTSGKGKEQTKVSVVTTEGRNRIYEKRSGNVSKKAHRESAGSDPTHARIRKEPKANSKGICRHQDENRSDAENE